MKQTPILKYQILMGLVLFVFTISSCKESSLKEKLPIKPKDKTSANILEKKQIDYDNNLWKEINETSGIVLDLKYATTDNFTKKQIYPCARCFLRPEVADKIIRIQKDIKSRYGYSLKMYDCYRPKPAQQKLWDIVPDARYVTPPSKGSMHNRGQAIDMSIVDRDGKELDMGTAYDFFGPDAYTDYIHSDPTIRRNRKLIKELMMLHGFTGIRTEWWHFSIKSLHYPLDDWQWDCN